VHGSDTLTAAAAVDGDTIWVTLGGEVFQFQLMHGRAKVTAHDHDALTPPMSATVTRIAVKPGDEVKTGDVLIALEAMKMELPIRAPRDGVITAVNCREGDLVQPGQELIDM
jgi:3-methylcrotonyl-CoA carboxylase alpha subunit